jgi:condensation domain-containing protein
VPAAREQPASVGQRVLWMMEHFSGAGGTLNSPLLYHVRGPLDLQRLRDALHLVAARHEALRTTFRAGVRLTRVIHDTPLVQFHEAGISGPAGVSAGLTRELKDQLARRFSLADEPLRCLAYRLGGGEHALAIVTHHLATDGWSAGVISRELGAAYQYLDGQCAELPPLGWQYSDFVTWQQSRLAGSRLRALQESWMGQLRGLALPRLPAAPSGPSPQPASAIEWEWLSPRAVRALRQQAPGQGTTPFVLLLSAFYAVLHRQTGQRDLAVASLMANRGHPKTRTTVGFLANMVVLRTAFQHAGTFADLVREATKTSMHALRHQELPCQMLPPSLFAGLPGRPHDIVFQVLARDSLSLAIDGLEVTPMRPPDGIRHRFGLEFLLCPARDDGLHIMIRFAADRFDPAWVRRLAAEYRGLVDGIAEGRPVRLSG